MKICVNFLGQARSATQRERVDVECASGATVAQAVELIARQFGEALARVILDDAGRPQASVILFLNNEQVLPGAAAELKDGDQLTLMPPISGG